MDKIIAKGHIRVYDVDFDVVLKEVTTLQGFKYYQMVDVYENCEHERGIPYTDKEDAINGLKKVVGKKYETTINYEP